MAWNGVIPAFVHSRYKNSIYSVSTWGRAPRPNQNLAQPSKAYQTLSGSSLYMNSSAGLEILPRGTNKVPARPEYAGNVEGQSVSEATRRPTRTTAKLPGPNKTCQDPQRFSRPPCCHRKLWGTSLWWNKFPNNYRDKEIILREKKKKSNPVRSLHPPLPAGDGRQCNVRICWEKEFMEPWEGGEGGSRRHGAGGETEERRWSQREDLCVCRTSER